jgi:hypothetical protein
MKFANATNLNRKSGAAKWRDLLFAYSATTLNRSPTLPFVIPSEPPEFLPRNTDHEIVCGFPQRKPHAPRQGRRDLQESRG